jgi:multiple sugar transport system permease protein
MEKDISKPAAHVSKYSKNQRAEHVQGYLFLTPAIIVLLIFVILSVFFVIFLSFNRVNLFTGTYKFVGFKNYLRIANDDMAKIALVNTLSFCAVVVPIQTLLSIILAVALNSKIRGKYTFRAILFLPTLTSSSALTMIFMFIFNVNGPINGLLENMGLISQGINFLGNPSFALKVIMAMNIWSTIPYYMTLYLASLQDLPVSMYEAAEIDGANVVKKFLYITVPYLKPITTYVLLTGIIGTLQMFDQAYIFSGGTGGPSNSTLTLSLMIYQYAFGPQNAMGYAAMLAIVLAIIIFAISFMAQRLNKYENDY